MFSTRIYCFPQWFTKTFLHMSRDTVKYFEGTDLVHDVKQCNQMESDISDIRHRAS